MTERVASVDNAAMNSDKASSPPADAPIATMVFSVIPTLSRFAPSALQSTRLVRGALSTTCCLHHATFDGCAPLKYISEIA
jgi:hypothetical protein